MSSQRRMGQAIAVLAALMPWGAAAVRAQEQPATLVVRVPADAQLTIEGRETQQRGEVRHFHSPPLTPGRTYRYQLQARWTRDGQPIRQSRTVRLRAGEEVTVDFTTPQRPAPAPVMEKPAAPTASQPRADVPPAEKPPLPSSTRRPIERAAVGVASREPDVAFIPTPPEVVDKMLELANVNKKDVVYDLGCGDGRIVVAAAKKYGCRAVGVDIDPRRVEESLENVRKAGVSELVTIRQQDLFTVDLRDASVVTLYLLPSLNLRLLPQLQKMKPGSRIVSHNFSIEGIKSVREVIVTARDGEHKIYLWETPLQRE